MDVRLVAVFAVEGAHDWRAVVAGTDLAAVFVSLESKLAAHPASDPGARS